MSPPNDRERRITRPAIEARGVRIPPDDVPPSLPPPPQAGRVPMYPEAHRRARDTRPGLGTVPLRDAAEDEPDTGHRSADTLSDELAEKVAERRRLEAELRAERLARQEAEARLAAAQGETTPKATKAGNAVATIVGALGGAAGIATLIQAFSMRPAPLPTEAIQQAVAAEVKKAEIARATKDTTRANAEAARWTITAAFLCAQGLRAKGLDCDRAQDAVQFEAQPLKTKAAPVWRTREEWPEARAAKASDDR